MTTTAAVYPEVAELLDDASVRSIDARVRKLMAGAVMRHADDRVAIRVTVTTAPGRTLVLHFPEQRGAHPGLTLPAVKRALYDELAAWVRAGEPEQWSQLLRQVYMGEVLLP